MKNEAVELEKDEVTVMDMAAPLKDMKKDLDEKRKAEKEVQYTLFAEYIKNNLGSEYKDKPDVSLYKIPKLIKVWPVVPDNDHSGLGSLDQENVEFLNFSKENGLEISTGGDWQDSWYVRMNYDIEKKQMYVCDFKPYSMVSDKFKAKDKKKRMSWKDFVEFVAAPTVIEIEIIEEKAKSETQQRLFGMVVAYKKGNLDTKNMDDSLVSKIKDMADGISMEDAEDFAKTKHKGLPEKVKKECNIISFEEFEKL